jgi:peptidoglycan hydrolase FlgJ
MAGPLLNPKAIPLRPAHYLKPQDKALPLDKDRQAQGETQKLKAACDNFEALFMQQLFKQMRSSIPKDALFGGGSAEQIYTEMLDGELSKKMAGSGALGISRLLFDYMTAAQGAGSETKD